MPLEVWIFLLGVIAILLFYFYRLGIANQQHLTEEQCDEFSWLVVDELFKSSPQIGYFVEVLSAYWRDIGRWCQWVVAMSWLNASVGVR